MKTMFNYFENKAEISSFLGNNLSYINIILEHYKVIFSMFVQIDWSLNLFM